MISANEREEVKEQVDLLVDVSGIAIDKMVEKGIPRKTAKLAKAYRDAFLQEGFGANEANSFVEAILKSGNNNNKS